MSTSTSTALVLMLMRVDAPSGTAWSAGHSTHSALAAAASSSSSARMAAVSHVVHLKCDQCAAFTGCNVPESSAMAPLGACKSGSRPTGFA